MSKWQRKIDAAALAAKDTSGTVIDGITDLATHAAEKAAREARVVGAKVQAAGEAVKDAGARLAKQGE